MNKSLVNITSNYPYPKFSFSGIFLANQISYLHDVGWEISTIHPFARISRGRFGTPEYERTESCDVYRPSYDWAGGQLHRLYPFDEWWSFEKSVSECIKKYILPHSVPDLILGNWLYPAGPGSVHIAQKLGVPAVLIARGGDVVTLSKMDDRRKDRVMKLLEGSDIIIANNHTLLGDIRKLLPEMPDEKISAMDFGVDTEIFSPSSPADRLLFRKKFQLDLRKKSILYVGRWEKEKGCLDFLNIIPQVIECINGWDFVVAGPVFEKESAKKIQNLCPSVKFLGTVPPNQIAELYKACDIFLFMSHSEGQPNVVKEAMASGLPVISYNVGGVSELIIDGVSGSVVPLLDQDSAFKELISFCSLSELRNTIGQAARQRMQEYFSARKQIVLLDQQLTTLVNHKLELDAN
jgi:glycosyltransferase involved in cell wall biosynthesis